MNGDSKKNLENIPADAASIDEFGDQRFISRRTKNSAVPTFVDTLSFYDREKSNVLKEDPDSASSEILRKNTADVEHSATTEASVSTDPSAENFRDIDNDSVYSDIASVSSRHSKTPDVKQYIRLLAKLKNENMLLRESLEKTNLTDIVTLKTALRGSKSDIIQLRQYNSELKDRVQILEQRLFDALANLTSKEGNDVVKDKSVIFENENVIDKRETKLDDQIKMWKSKCSHLSRLVKSYEKKMGHMELEIDSLREKSGAEPRLNESVEVTPTAVQRLQSKVASLEMQREVDQKVIRELTLQLKNLESAGVVENEKVDTPEGDPTLPTAAASARELDPVTITAVTESDSAESKFRNTPIHSYSSNQMMLSFAAGLLLMMLCTLLVSFQR